MLGIREFPWCERLEDEWSSRDSKNTQNSWTRGGKVVFLQPFPDPYLISKMKIYENTAVKEQNRQKHKAF